jgi:hypothetical protein
MAEAGEDHAAVQLIVEQFTRWHQRNNPPRPPVTHSESELAGDRAALFVRRWPSDIARFPIFYRMIDKWFQGYEVTDTGYWWESAPAEQLWNLARILGSMSVEHGERLAVGAA